MGKHPVSCRALKNIKPFRYFFLAFLIVFGFITIFDSCGGGDSPSTPSTYSISGAVSGDMIEGVTITLSETGSATTTTGTNGSYNFSGLENGSYTITPSLRGYTFKPSSTAVTINDANVTAINFTIMSSTSVTYLSKIQDQFHVTFDVYSDAYAAGNHFAARGMLNTASTMQENWSTAPHSGGTCIRCEFNSSNSWGGWYMMNGILQGSNTSPSLNWGETANAGVDLSGATKITFWAKGNTGGEKVEFFALGVGRDSTTGVATEPYPDSSTKVSTGTVTLSNEWTQYTISLVGCNLSYVLGGFGWIAVATDNAQQDIIFYLDDIIYDKSRTTDPHFLVSYATESGTKSFDLIMRNVAYTYDNAVALISFLGASEISRAKLIADAFVYAQNNDRFFSDGRLRNAYQGGDLSLPLGWTPNGKSGTTRMPGWIDQTTNTWMEDAGQVGSDTGNMAWAMLALLAYYDVSKDDTYLSSVVKMADWVELNCRDTRGAGGYTAGYYGWETNQTKRTYKSTEHNIDLYAVFQRLFLITGNTNWRDRAQAAKQFVVAMWDSTQGQEKFWTGTGDDGVTINITQYQMPLDVQAWAILSLKDEGILYRNALTYVEQNMQVFNEDKTESLGFDFNNDLDGIWYEGTAQMTAAYILTAQQEKINEYLSILKAAQLTTGAIPAASKESITTGFQLPDGSDWLYYCRPHIGATAWLLLVENNINPFWP